MRDWERELRHWILYQMAYDHWVKMNSERYGCEMTKENFLHDITTRIGSCFIYNYLLERMQKKYGT